MKKIKILVSTLLFILTACANAPRQKLGTVLPELFENDFSTLKHTVGCNSLAPLAIINHYYNDDSTAISNFVDKLENTIVRRYEKLPENKDVACPQVNTYTLSNDEVKFTFDIINMFVIKDDMSYELEKLPSFLATRTSNSFSGSTTVLKILDATGKEVTGLSLTLPQLEFEEISETNQNNVKFTVETVGGVISIYDAVTFSLNVGEQMERFYKVISDDTFASLFDNTQPKKLITVGVDYGTLVDNKVSVILSEELDLINQRLLDKNDMTREINNLLPGDNLEVYFKNDSYEEINHILVEPVDELNEIQVTNAVAPGSDKMEIFVEYKNHPNVAILHKDIHYIINEDQTYTTLDSLEMFMDLYATYKESDITTYTSGSVTIQQISLIALYSYPPRIQ